MESPALFLPTSTGGHAELLMGLEPAFADVPHMWVLPPGAQAEELRRRGERVATVVNPRRNPVRLARNVAQTIGVLRRGRPRVVLSSGTNAAVPFCLLAKAAGARLLFVETMARVVDGSATGRLLYRFADAFLVQWPELLAIYPKAEVCRPLLLEDVSTVPATPGEGTFVAAGTHSQPFDRLLRMADAAAGAGILPLPVLAQAGASDYRPRHMERVDALAPDEVRRAMSDHRLVISHCGSGLVSLALRSGRRPLVLPRRRAHGEHVDDHQVATTAKLAELGLVVSLDELPIERAVGPGLQPPVPPADLPGRPLVERVRELIAEAS